MSKYVEIKRIEFVVTWQCNSHCKHCSVSDKKVSRPTSIDADIAIRIIKEITGTYSPTSIMTFGGEPLLYPDVTRAIHRTAAECGIGNRQIITNAGWPRSGQEFRAVTGKLAESGVNWITISVDAFHQEYIPIEVVGRNAKMLADAGIPVKWNPCWVISKDHRNPWNERTKAVLEELVGNTGIAEGEGNVVQPAGNALKWLGDFLPAKTSSPNGKCDDVPYAGRLDSISCISIEPDADIKVCNEYSIGNALKRSVVDILEKYNPYKDPEAEAILQGGMLKLTEYARKKGILPDPDGYYTICGMCTDLRRKLAGLDNITS